MENGASTDAINADRGTSYIGGNFAVKNMFNDIGTGWVRGVNLVGAVVPGETLVIATDAVPTVSNIPTPDARIVRYTDTDWSGNEVDRYRAEYRETLDIGFRARFFIDIGGENSTLKFKAQEEPAHDQN